MSRNSQKAARTPESSGWFFIQNEHDDTCVIGDPTERMPVARAASADVATRICKAVNDRDAMLAALKAINSRLKESRTTGKSPTFRDLNDFVRWSEAAIAKAEGRANG